MREIGIGLADFKELIEEGIFYVDKTKFIEDIVKDKTEVQSITRPRRFGKTFKDIKADSVEKMFICLKAVISDLFEKYKYIRESLDERNIEIFDRIWKREDEDYSSSLIFLSKCLKEYYKQDVVLSKKF